MKAKTSRNQRTGADDMPETRNYRVVHFDELATVPCPCGLSQRAFIDDADGTASVHVVEIKEDSELHYHRRLTEIYYILDGEGYMELDGERVRVRPGSSILIKPGCRHRAVGRLKVLNLVVPAFDPEDECFDDAGS